VVCGVGQERLGPSYFFISLVLGPQNSLLWYVPSSRYIWRSSFLFLQEQIKDIIIILCNRQALPVVLDVLGGLGIVPERIIRVAEGVLDKQSIARHRGPHGDCHRRGRALLLCHTPPVCSIVKQLQSLQHSLLVSRRCRCRAGASARSGPRTRPCARPEMVTPMREGVWDWLLVVLNAVSVHT
jgi:hypothetical protein